MNIRGKWKIEGKERNISAGPTHVLKHIVIVCFERARDCGAKFPFHLLSMVNVELVD